jgi:plastocyanin
MSRMNTLIKSALLGACAISGATSVAANSHDLVAFQHEVYIYPDGFFPNKVYADWGETIRYVNKSGTAQDMSIPYYYSNYYGQMRYQNFRIYGNAEKFVTVYPSGTFTVRNPDGDYGEDGYIIRATAPREGFANGEQNQ